MADEAGRRSFRRIVGLGLPLAALAAVAAAKPWYGASGQEVQDVQDLGSGLSEGLGSPLASAVSLVLLAAWGVLLVTRGGVRRAFALVAALASVGLVVTVVTAWVTLPDHAGDSFDQLMGRSARAGYTGWFWTAAVAAVLAVPPALVAVRRAADWPEMGRRYDAPGARTTSAPAAPQTDRDLWDRLDEGEDPTAPAPATDPTRDRGDR